MGGESACGCDTEERNPVLQLGEWNDMLSNDCATSCLSNGSWRSPEVDNA